MKPETNVTKNFKFYELIRSFEAAKNNLDNTPNKEQEKELIRLGKTILQPIRDKLGCPLILNSVFRSPAVNKLVKGSKTSQHLKGQAADCRVANMSIKELITLIPLNLPFHQLINEYNLWVHISTAPLGVEPKRQMLYKDKEGYHEYKI